MTHRPARALLLLLLLLTYPVGCTSRAQKTVATVGDRTITVGEMEETAGRVAKDNPAYFGSEPDSAARRHLLDDLINKDLLALEAESRHLADVDSIARQVKAATSSALLQALYKDQVEDKAKISDSDVRKAYDRLQDSMIVKHIVVSTEDSAKLVIQRLKAGTSFDSLAREVSRDTGTRDQGGLLPGFSGGDMVPTFEDAVWKLRPGQTSGPVKTPFGWHVIRLVERGKRAHVAKFDEVREQLRESLKRRAASDRLATYLEELRAEHHVAWTPNGVSKLDEVLTGARRAAGDTAKPGVIKIGVTLPPGSVASRADSATVVVRYDDKGYTIGQALVSIRQMPAFMRPAPGDTARIHEFVDGEVLKALLEADATKRGLPNHPDVKKAMQSKREEVLVTALYLSDIERTGSASEAQAQSYYERHPEMFQAPRRVSFYRVTVESKTRADSVYAVVKKGKRLSAIGKQLGEDQFGLVGPAPDQTVQDDPNDITVRAFGMDVGQVSAPMQYPAGSNTWVVFETTAKKQPGLLTYADVKAQAARGATVELQEARLKTLLENLHRRYPVTVHEDALAEVRFPARPAGQSADSLPLPTGGTR